VQLAFVLVAFALAAEGATKLIVALPARLLATLCRAAMFAPAKPTEASNGAPTCTRSAAAIGPTACGPYWPSPGFNSTSPRV
jgi:hypothetical protein